MRKVIVTQGGLWGYIASVSVMWWAWSSRSFELSGPNTATSSQAKNQICWLTYPRKVSTAGFRGSSHAAVTVLPPCIVGSVLLGCYLCSDEFFLCSGFMAAGSTDFSVISMERESSLSCFSRSPTMADGIEFSHWTGLNRGANPWLGKERDVSTVQVI